MRNICFKIILFLYLNIFICGCAVPEKQKIILPVEFTGLELTLGGKITDDFLKHFRYLDSLDAYYLKGDSGYYFNYIYLWVKKNIIYKIMLEVSPSPFFEYQKYEIIVNKILLSLKQYGDPKITDNNFGKNHIITNNLFHASWQYDNVSIEFIYLPKENYEKIRNSISNDEDIWYIITYFYSE